MIQLNSVTKSYGKINAATDLNFHIPRGQVVGLLGPNGAGKSTTIRMIAGLLPPTLGTITVDNLDSIADSPAIRRRLGYLPEANPLYPEMRVIDFLTYRAALHAIPRRKRRDAVDRAIDHCDLKDVRPRRIAALSKGYRQRVGLAAALVHDPDLLILDEPTSGLDPAQIAETRSLMRQLAGERTTLLVSHLLAEVERTCDRVIVFAAGRIRADGTPSDLVPQAATQAPCLLTADANTRQLNDALAPLRNHAKSIDITPPTRGDRPSQARITPNATASPADLRAHVGRALLAAKIPIIELRTDAPTLESLYLSLVEHPHPTDPTDHTPPRPSDQAEDHKPSKQHTN